jgi:5-methylcytosine-specific restriction endonuclease McrA
MNTNKKTRKEIWTKYNQKETTKQYKRNWHEQNYFGHTGLLKDKKCAICQGKKDLLIHHIDGDRNNNKLNNLVVLCRRCHPKVHNRWWLKKI